MNKKHSSVLHLHYVSTQRLFLVLFSCKVPSPFCKSSKRKNHLKPVSLETIFLLSALKRLTKSVPSYQAEKQCILRRSLTLLWFLEFATVYSYFKVQVCSYFIVSNKIFCFFQKWVCIFGRGYISRGKVKFSKILRGLLLKGEGDERFIICFGGTR